MRGQTSSRKDDTMARAKSKRKSRRNTLSVFEIIDVLQRSRRHLPALQRRHDELLTELERLGGVISALGATTATRPPSTRTSGANPRRRRAARGSGWAALEAAL